MTITEKIIAAHCGKETVEPGEYVYASLDMAMGHDNFADSLPAFLDLGAEQVWDPDRLALIPDNLIPAQSIFAANRIKDVRDFAREQGVTHFYDTGRSGVCHNVMTEEGLVLPGDLVVGADSHTVTYGATGAFSTGVGAGELAIVAALGEIWLRVPASIKFDYRGALGPWVGAKDLILYTIGQIGVEGALYQSMEFTGEVVRRMGMPGRFTLCNMSVEAGAKNGIIAADETTLKYLRPRAKRSWKVVESDPDAQYATVYEWDVSGLQPQVACPHLPSNVKPVEAVSEVTVDQVFIGSCTNGRIEDLREAANVLRGQKVHPYVRLVVIPASQESARGAVSEGLAEIFIDAGAAFGTPSCGPCAGWQSGILGRNERCVSTTNRNFIGRMGDTSSEVYLVNPAVAAATAVMGRLASPAELAGVRA